MHKRLAVLYLVLLLGCAAACWAQKETLLIGPGDLIEVNVLDTPEMQQQVRVTDAGTVSLAYVGSVHVGGESPSGAAATIQEALVEKEVMRHPQVTVRVEEYATQDVSVVGQVHTPGTYPIATPQTILHVISLAGGLTDIADRRVTVKRAGTGDEVTYYLANDAKQALADVVMVNPGDTLVVPKAPVVYVMGDVNRPGGYAVVTNNSRLTVMQAISDAGSVTKTAVQSKVRLIRATPEGQVEIPVHLDAIQRGREPDIALQSDDVVYVPFSWIKNAAIGSATIAASTAGAALYLAR